MQPERIILASRDLMTNILALDPFPFTVRQHNSADHGNQQKT
jgi:hypothetical protein